MKGARSSPRAIPSRLIPICAGDVEEKAPPIESIARVSSTQPSPGFASKPGVRGDLVAPPRHPRDGTPPPTREVSARPRKAHHRSHRHRLTISSSCPNPRSPAFHPGSSVNDASPSTRRSATSTTATPTPHTTTTSAAYRCPPPFPPSRLSVTSTSAWTKPTKASSASPSHSLGTARSTPRTTSRPSTTSRESRKIRKCSSSSWTSSWSDTGRRARTARRTSRASTQEASSSVPRSRWRSRSRS